jgi:hypothetical protein
MVGNMTPSDLTDGVTEIPCDRITELTHILREIDRASAPGKRNQLKRWGINPEEPVDLETALAALDMREKMCLRKVDKEKR